jgi:hypothetical protein
MTSDVCGLAGHNYSDTHRGVDLFLYLIGSGVSRTLYMLTGYEHMTQTFLFDIRVQADLQTLVEESSAEQASADDRVAAVAFQRARQIVDRGLDRPQAHYELEVYGDGGTFVSTPKRTESKIKRTHGI